MKTSHWLNLFLAVCLFHLPSTGVRAAESPSPIKILIVDGFGNHDWKRTTKLVGGILDTTGLFQVTVATAPASTNDPAYALRIGTNEAVERIPPGEGNNTSHGARTDRVVHRLGEHPIHAGLPRRWKTPAIEVYTYARGPAENVTVLSWAEEPKTQERWPIEWTVQWGNGRVYNSTFGHVWLGEADPVDMRCAGFQTVLVRSLQWLAKRPVTFPVPTDFPTADATVLRVMPATF